METPDIIEPPEPQIFIHPTQASVSISSGQSVSVNFTLRKIGAVGEVSLSVGSLPQGITAAFPGFTGLAPQFTLTFTAALNVTPAEATIQVTASGANTLN